MNLEFVDIFERLWTGERVTHQGKYYSFEGVTIEPRLPEWPFLWVAGRAKAKTSMSPDPKTIAPGVLERVCRRADGWIARAAGLNRSVIEDWQRIAHRLDEIGRPGGFLRRRARRALPIRSLYRPIRSGPAFRPTASAARMPRLVLATELS